MLPPGVAFYLGGIPDHNSICYTTKPKDGLKPEEAEAQGFALRGTSWVKLNPVTYALIWSSNHVRLAGITPYNVLEWKYRLDLLAETGIFFLTTPTPDGPIPFRVSFSEIRDHLGLRTSIEVEWSNTQFDFFIRTRRMAQLKEVLKDHDAI